MKAALAPDELMRELGRGSPIRDVCRRGGLDESEFETWWNKEARRRLPDVSGTRHLPVRDPVEVLRDQWGVPHIFAESDRDLFVAYGWAMAQDRLFQLDHQRRRGHGRLAEVFGPAFLEQDITARTIGINRIAEAELAGYDEATRELLEGFSSGVNAWIEASLSTLPIECALLGYEPEAWTPLDCAVSTGMWRWQLTGRPWVIAVPELIKRDLADERLYHAYLSMQREVDEESIIPAGSGAYPGDHRPPLDPGPSLDGGIDGGSNNWVIGGGRTASGRPIVASDPHMPYAAVSSFYEVHLSGGSFEVYGAGFVGTPGLVFGRNERVAWAVTNNICSLRDIYQEREDPAHPGSFLYDGGWEPWGEIHEEIAVAGSAPHQLTVRFSRNGPIIDELLPPAARGTGPVSMRWVGSTYCDWLPAQLRAARATSAADFRLRVRGWRAPTFNLLFADVDGHIGYQASGAIPIRQVAERGYRPGWDPAHQWFGLIPPEGMPQIDDPALDWLASANNRPAPDGFPYPLSGTWDEGHRARRIGRLIEGLANPAKPEDVARMHQDVWSSRAADRLPGILAVLGDGWDAVSRAAIGLLRDWDRRMAPESVAATLFAVFNTRWTQVVAAERLAPERAEYVSAWLNGLAGRLIGNDEFGWFRKPGRRAEALRKAFSAALDELRHWCGPDMSVWTWGSLHTLTLRHVLSSRGELAELLDHRPFPVAGDGHTVWNTGFTGAGVTAETPRYGALWEAISGAGYRFVVDLGSDPPIAWGVTVEGQSGQAGSPHFSDQEQEFLAGRYHEVPLSREGAERVAVTRQVLAPADEGRRRTAG